MSLDYEIRNNSLLWIKNPFTGVISYALDLRAKSFTYTLKKHFERKTEREVSELDAQLRQQAIEECPFCPGHEDRSPEEIMRVLPVEIPHWRGAGSTPNPKWVIRVFNNLFPRIPSELTGNKNESYLIVEDPRHFLDEARHPDDLLYSGALGEEHFFVVLRTAAHVIERALENPAIGSVVVRKNQGPESGASQPHIHQQVIGSPGLLPALEAEVRAQKHDPHVWEEIVELVDRLGLVIERREGLVSYLSPIGAFPQSYEVVMPKFYGLLSQLSPELMRHFALAVYRILAFLGPIPLDYEIHQGAGLPLHAHINVRLFPYSNVAGTLNIPHHIGEIAARVRRKVGLE